MASRLDVIASIWKDPEAKYLSLNTDKSRKDFFMEMCRGNSEAHGLDKIKTVVSQYYEEDPLLAGELMDLFDVVASNWTSVVREREIPNLTTYLAALIGNDLVGDVKITEDLYPYAPPEISLVGMDLVASKFGVFSDFATLGTKDVPVFYNVSPEYEDGSVCLLKSNRIKKRIPALKDKLPIFAKIAAILHDGDYPVGTLFVDKRRFNKKGSTCTVTLGSSFITASVVKTITLGGVKFHECKHIEFDMESTVICLI
jgi:hypothetical protein